jgi:hypothetical protein
MVLCDECGNEKHLVFPGMKDGKPINWCLYCIRKADDMG